MDTDLPGTKRDLLVAEKSNKAEYRDWEYTRIAKVEVNPSIQSIAYVTIAWSTVVRLRGVIESALRGLLKSVSRQVACSDALTVFSARR